MDAISDRLKESGVNEQIETNGYWYRFNHYGLHVEFCAQHSLDGDGRFVGAMYDEKLSPDQIKEMNNQIEKVGYHHRGKIGKPEEWANLVRKYNCKRIIVPGYLDNIIPELMDLITMPMEVYIKKRLMENDEYNKIDRELTEQNKKRRDEMISTLSKMNSIRQSTIHD